jgi:hypothetical protein
MTSSLRATCSQSLATLRRMDFSHLEAGFIGFPVLSAPTGSAWGCVRLGAQKERKQGKRERASCGGKGVMAGGMHEQTLTQPHA